MKLIGNVYFNEDGLSQSVRAMHVQTELIGIGTKNIMGFDKIGFQRKEPVVSSFSELIGIHGVSAVKDDTVGRIISTGYPLHLALAEKGYFQTLNDNGSINLTRDGRFNIDKNGYLTSVEGDNVLALGGEKFRFSKIPEDFKNIKISPDGTVKVYDPKTGLMNFEGIISVVSQEGAQVVEPDMKQGYVEASNVDIPREMFAMFPAKRNFTANYQMFLLQNSNLSTAINKIGLD